MIRLIGAVMVAGACLWTGWNRRQWYRHRRQTLGEFCHAFSRMEAELSSRQTDTVALFTMLCAGNGRVQAVFRAALDGMTRLEYEPLSCIWTQALEGCRLPLRREEMALLDRAGAVLGRYDGPGQAMLLSRIRSDLERCLDEAREDERRQGKTAVLLSMTIGLAVVLLLI